jgi:hypothetical protein
MKQEIIKTHWRLYLISFAVFAVLAGALGYYYFLFAPQSRVKAFTSRTNELYESTKEDVSYMNSAVIDWDVFVKGDLASKTTQLTEIKDRFNNLKNELSGLSQGQEIDEAYGIMIDYTDRGYKVANELAVIAEYFKKVEGAVAAFNGLNTKTNDIEALKKLVLDFKSVSQESLAELEKIEAPQELLEIDKDYKDLLRQYIESADLLKAAIDSNNTNKVEEVGKKADEDVNAISRQLNEDLSNFSDTSSISADLKSMLNLRGILDEKIANLKDRYRV